MQTIPVADMHQMKAFQCVIRAALGRILDIFIILILSLLFPLSSFPLVPHRTTHPSYNYLSSYSKSGLGAGST